MLTPKGTPTADDRCKCGLLLCGCGRCTSCPDPDLDAANKRAEVAEEKNRIADSLMDDANNLIRDLRQELKAALKEADHGGLRCEQDRKFEAQRPSS